MRGDIADVETAQIVVEQTVERFGRIDLDQQRRHPAALASLTKGGLAAVTRALAIEYESRRVR